MQFARKARPESLAAAKAVSSILTMSFKDGNCSPMGSDPSIKSILDRLAKENYAGSKATVVFFTCEKAREGDYVENPVLKRKLAKQRTQASTLSQKVYDSIFDVVNARSATIYTMYANLVKVDISDITKGDDRFLNRDTGPFLVFYKPDGEISGIIKGRYINASSYCREMSKVLGNPARSRKQLVNVDTQLKQLEKLVKKQYVLNADLKSSKGKVSSYDRKKKKSSSSGGLGRGTSTAAGRIPKLETQVEEVTAQIAETKELIKMYTSTNVSEEPQEESSSYSY